MKNRREYLLVCLRALLTSHWLSEDKKTRMETRYNYAGVVYTNWISDTVVSRYGLTFQDKIDLNVVVHHYWQSLFKPEGEGIDYLSSAMYTSGLFGINEASSIKILKELKVPMNFEGLVDNMKAIIVDRRLKSLTGATLQTILSNIWLGNNARELSIVSLEHPPTFISMCFLSLTEKSTKNSLLTKFVTKYNRPNQDSFVADMTDNVLGHIDTSF